MTKSEMILGIVNHNDMKTHIKKVLNHTFNKLKKGIPEMDEHITKLMSLIDAKMEEQYHKLISGLHDIYDKGLSDDDVKYIYDFYFGGSPALEKLKSMESDCFIAGESWSEKLMKEIEAEFK